MNRRRSGVRVLLLALLTLGWPMVVSAHPMPGVADFYVGMLHPVMTIDCALPLLALGLLAGAQERRSILAMLAVIPLSIAAGAAMALVVSPPDSLQRANFISMAIGGVLVAVGVKMSVAPAAILSAIVTVPIGWAIGRDVGDQVSALRFIPGVGLSGFLIAAYCIGCSRKLRVPWMVMGFRVLGSWIAAVGILLSGLR
jgi:urease accessory protein